MRKDTSTALIPKITMNAKNSTSNGAEWNSTEFVRSLRLKEKIDAALLTPTEAAYLEILDGGETKQYATAKRELTAFFKKAFERDAIEKSYLEVIGRLSATRKLRPSAADIKRITEHGLVGLSEEEAAALKDKLATLRSSANKPRIFPSAPPASAAG